MTWYENDPLQDTFYEHQMIDSSSGHLIWTYIYPIRVAQCDRAVANFITSISNEVGRYAQIPLEEKTFQLCQQGVEFEEHYVCHCTDFNEISGR